MKALGLIAVIILAQSAIAELAAPVELSGPQMVPGKHFTIRVPVGWKHYVDKEAEAFCADDPSTSALIEADDVEMDVGPTPADEARHFVEDFGKHYPEGKLVQHTRLTSRSGVDEELIVFERPNETKDGTNTMAALFFSIGCQKCMGTVRSVTKKSEWKRCSQSSSRSCNRSG